MTSTKLKNGRYGMIFFLVEKEGRSPKQEQIPNHKSQTPKQRKHT